MDKEEKTPPPPPSLGKRIIQERQNARTSVNQSIYKAMRQHLGTQDEIINKSRECVPLEKKEEAAARAAAQLKFDSISS